MARKYSSSKLSDIDGECDTEATETRSNILYHVSDVPSFPATFVFALQVAAQIVSVTLTHAIMISHAICGTVHVTAKLLSTSMFICGLTTFTQALIGVRLPVFQATCMYYLAPVLSRANMPDWQCEEPDSLSVTNQTSLGVNGSHATPHEQGEAVWQERLMEISGVLMVVSVFHALIGAVGIGGYISRFIGPLTIAPAMVAMMLPILDHLLKFVVIHLGVAALTIAVMLILTTYMANVLVPIPYWTRSGGWKTVRSRFLKTYAVLISIGIGWLACHILTVTGALPDDPADIQYHARTDTHSDTIDTATWFYVPYPGQFGAPRFSLTLFFGLAVGMLSSVIDSVADYTIVSRVVHIPPPPHHATNRGLLIEGACSILAGAFGMGQATSTLVAVTGSLAITGVTSRRVFQVAGLFIMFLGVVGKVGAFFVIIPKPVIGAVILVILGSVTGTLVADLNDFEMKRPRNCMTVGLAILMGYLIPEVVLTHPDLLDTGVADLNNAVKAMFGTPLFVGGLVACILDNTLPGGRGELPDDDHRRHTSDESDSVHRLPYLHDYFTRCKWTRFVPFLPGFRQTVQNEDILLEPIHAYCK